MAEKTKPRPWTPAEERFGTVAVRIMSVVNTILFKASGGRIGNKFMRGAPVCLVTTTGAHSGVRRTTPLIYLDDGDDVVIVASKGGMSHHPGWYYTSPSIPRRRCRSEAASPTAWRAARAMRRRPRCGRV